ncbi:MAG: NHL repeat-containing protein [Chloroflexaceae bacterium]|nr:NHL repeat-containing protein [Chloroflexaceae bacterium]
MGIPRFRLLRLLTPLLLVVLAACTLPSAAPPATPEAPAGSPGPAPTSPPLEASYRSEVGGFALNYPQGWATRETSTTLLLAPSPADLERAAPADGLLIQIDSQPQASPPITTTETLFASSSAGLQQAGFTVGMPATMQVGGSPAQVADLQASNAAGRLLVIVSPTRQVRLLGQATPAGWQQQEGLFTAIVNSLRLFAPVVATPVPPDQATQPALLRQGPPGFVLRLGGSSGERTGRFASARGMAAAPDGTLYLAESSRGVWVFQPDGTLLRTFGKDDLLDAYDIARAENGDLFVADYGRNAIAHFRPDGTLVQRWGGAGDGPEQFGVSSPQRLALGPGGDVFALDVRQQEGNTVSSLVRFQPDGTFVERIALPEGAAPTDIVLDRVGNIYLAESVGGADMERGRAATLAAGAADSTRGYGGGIGQPAHGGAVQPAQWHCRWAGRPGLGQRQQRRIQRRHRAAPDEQYPGPGHRRSPGNCCRYAHRQRWPGAAVGQ